MSITHDKWINLTCNLEWGLLRHAKEMVKRTFSVLLCHVSLSLFPGRFLTRVNDPIIDKYPITDTLLVFLLKKEKLIYSAHLFMKRKQA